MFSGKKILFARICGTGMSSLAITVKRQGADVYGFDELFLPPISTVLKKEKIKTFESRDLENELKNNKPDIIVVGNALHGTSKNAQIILNSGVPYYSMPQFMEEFLIPDHETVVVAGTHGKTTTTTLISEFLHKLEMTPSYFIGGIPLFSMTNAAYEKNGYFVIEGDEYDTAFFDKTPKFLHYSPETTIITSIEFDHADIYDTLDQIYNNFKKLVKNTTGTTIISLDFPDNRRLLEDCKDANFFTYSLKDRSANLYIEFIGTDKESAIFNYYIKGRSIGGAKVSLFGEQNLMNVAALLSFIETEGIDVSLKETNNILSSMKGVKRRQEKIGTLNGGLIYSDFAHHPTAVEYTIDGFKKAFPDKKLIALFDPATNSNSKNIFENQYREIFLRTDFLIIGTPAKLDRFKKHEQFSPDTE